MIAYIFNINTLFFLAEFILMASYMLSSILLLRILVTISQLGFITASYIVGINESGMITTFIFSILTFVINSIHIYRLVYSKIPLSIPDKYKNAYESTFSSLTKREFMILLQHADTSIVNNKTIVVENEPCDVVLNINGSLEISIDNKVLTRLPANSLAGEISFLINGPSIASVKAVGEVEIYSWTRSKIAKIEKKYPDIFSKFSKILLNRIVSNLSAQNKVALSGLY